ncbi:MAG: hypothetical protein C0601_09540 [Candidatus Muiribacterium halophilum]|uniref:MurNAc-LAA domain-containing protein n=1 Tax=Muiribacterium halophilum TaxID=2053465 RepID=A0A2N5ZDH8_MUIH1|nr:MAG: hypothetical protein C0601_09540 [Candidatus Muirbacterium halophilum]
MAKKAIILIYIFTFMIFSFSINSISVQVNDITFKGNIDGDIVYLPLTDVCKEFDIKFGFFPDTNIIAINFQNKMMSTVVDQKELIVNNEISELENPPILINSEVYMPIEFFSKYLELDISWKPEEISKSSVISELVFRESPDVLEIFIKADKSFSKNEYFVIQDKRDLIISFPNTKIDLEGFEYPHDYIEDVNYLNEKQETAQLTIRFKNNLDIQLGPSVKPAGMYIRVNISDVQKTLPENRDVLDTSEIISYREPGSIEVSASEIPLISTTEVASVISLDSQETYEVEDSYIEEVPDIELQQYTFVEETSENILENKVIVIDPGHGGSDYGITKFGIYEKDIVLSIGRKLFDKLSEGDASVFLTRKGNENLTDEKRSYVANSNRAQLFLSLHLAFSRDEKISGFSIYYSPQSENDLKDKQDSMEELKNIKRYDDSIKF